MAERCAALTEKEKQTLRLLVTGYDAKSIARHLGLSVHTVNERLRDARRKLAVSSSREAARILRAAEGEPPETLADKQLGAALAANTRHTAAIKPGLAAPRSKTLAVGGSIMLVVAAAFAFATSPLAVPVAAPALNPAGAAAIVTEASETARRWLELGDAARWDQGYQATARAFQAANTPAKWTEVSLKVRSPLGALKSRALLGADDVPSPQGYHIVKFRSSFAGRARAIETVSLVREGGVWKVAGVYLD